MAEGTRTIATKPSNPTTYRTTSNPWGYNTPYKINLFPLEKKEAEQSNDHQEECI
jgi:hypothetical protein